MALEPLYTDFKLKNTDFFHGGGFEKWSFGHFHYMYLCRIYALISRYKNYLRSSLQILRVWSKLKFLEISMKNLLWSLFFELSKILVNVRVVFWVVQIPPRNSLKFPLNFRKFSVNFLKFEYKNRISKIS